MNTQLFNKFKKKNVGLRKLNPGLALSVYFVFLIC